MSQNIEVTCPCCQTRLLVDKVSGKVVWHHEKTGGPASFESAFAQMEAKKSEAAQKFQKELDSQKDRSRILDEKFKQAMDRATGQKEEGEKK